MRRLSVVGAAAFCALLWASPGPASAAMAPQAAFVHADTAMLVHADSGAAAAIEPVDYVWRGRHYPYRWRGQYYPYRWRGGYYRHRRWLRNGWRYY